MMMGVANFTTLVVACALAAALVGTVATAQQPVARMCFVARASRTSAFMTAAHAVDTYRARFPSYDWQMRAVGRNGNGIIKDAVQAFAVNGTDCDLLFGPGASSYSVALSPVVDVPWVDFSASSVELSDDLQHPFFSRMIPSDEYLGNGMATFMRGLGWGTINVVCGNEAYGRSITQRLSASFALAGGKIGVSTCLESNAGIQSASELFSVLATSPSRIVAVGMNSASEAFRSFINVTVERKLYEQYVFLFSESMCSGDQQWRAIPGALCMTFRSNASRVEEFRAHYRLRNPQPAIAKLASIGIAVDGANLPDSITVFDGFSHDAVLHTMAAVHARATATTTAALSDRTGIKDAIRRTITQGLSGTVALDSIGDRSQAQLLVLNIDASGNEQAVAYLENETVYGERTSSITAAQSEFAQGLPTVFWFGLYRSNVPPVDIVESKFELSIGLIAIAISAVLVAAVLAFAICVARRNREALERLMAGSLIGITAMGILALCVVTVKLLVAAAIIIDDNVPLGYAISYLSVASVGILSSITDCFFRFRFIGEMLTSDDGMPFAEEQAAMLRLKGFAVFTTVMSDLPTLVIAATMIATGTGQTRLELLVALAAIAAFAVGMKITSVPSFLSDIARKDPAEDEDDEFDEDSDVGDLLTESALLPATAALAASVDGDNGDAQVPKKTTTDEQALEIEDIDQPVAAATPKNMSANGVSIPVPSRPDGDEPLIAIAPAVSHKNPLAGDEHQQSLQKVPTHGDDVSWDAIYQQPHQNHHHHQNGGANNLGGDDGGTDGHSARTSSGLQFKLQQAGRTVAARLQEERIRKKQLLDFIFPEILRCYNITPQQAMRSRFGAMLGHRNSVQASHRNLLAGSVRQAHASNAGRQPNQPGTLHH